MFMTYKRHKVYYFVNKTTKGLDSLRIIDIFEDGFVYSYHEKYKFCSFKNAEGKPYESDRDLELLRKLGKCRQSCYYNATHRCSSYRCPCPIFLHVLDPTVPDKVIAREKEKAEYTDLELYPFGDR